MGMSASQGRLLLLTARRSDLEFRAQQISQKRLCLSQQLEQISLDYEDAVSDRQMKIDLYLNGENDGNTETRRTTNLTYAALVSGTVGAAGPGKDKAGIQASKVIGTDKQEYTSNTPYRLVSTDGAIVVADISEIPTVKSTTASSTTPEYEEGSNIYKVSNQTIDNEKGDSTTTSESKFYVVAPTKTADGKVENTPLSEQLGTGNDLNVKINAEKQLVVIDDVYYSTVTGEVVENNEALEFEDAILVKNKSQVPSTTSTTNTFDAKLLVEGADGVYTLYDSTDPNTRKQVQRYIVDESLRYGSTDVNGTTSGPNYLQDCLRNGKYLLEKGVVDNNVDGKYRWSSLSWDTATNVKDYYYEENDDKAKAKYDRLQSQIQAQDKKLELELDNIETQRNAVTTEIESVEKVIQEDIESTFNTFG